ncbi:hypothetical protein HK405_002410, partial [Cladochytrium tenue]
MHHSGPDDATGAAAANAVAAAQAPPPEVLARVAFYAATRGSIPAATSATVNPPARAHGNNPLRTVHVAECRRLAELRRVAIAWCH